MSNGVRSGNGYAKITFIDYEDMDNINYEDKELEMKIGRTYQFDINKLSTLTAITIDQVSFESSNTDVATVDKNGKITAKAEGKARIKITDTTNGHVAYINVHVLQGIQPKFEIGSDFTVALKADGTVWTWGKNTNGQLGTGDNYDREEPTQILSNIKVLRK